MWHEYCSMFSMEPIFGKNDFSRPEPALILVGDDDTMFRNMLVQLLEEHGFQTLPAEDGAQSVELAIEYLPALVILDISMPKMDGYTALARLRGNSRTREIPVIILTGAADGLYKGLSAGLGAVDHVTKPFRPQDLLELVHHSLPGRGR